MLRKSKTRQTTVHSLENELASEYNYASHHHLIPLYVLSGLAVLALLVMGCFIGVLWQTGQQESMHPAANSVLTATENLYIPATISPAEKKQYVYSANIRFPIDSPYDTLRYAYDPGTANTRTSATVTLTTARTLQSLESPLINHPEKVNDYAAHLQQCARLYAIRFEPGLTPYGNFELLKSIKLKDGRTAYIHKNTACVPDSVQAMNNLDNLEKDILAVESF